jgi:hypothetical protein
VWTYDESTAVLDKLTVELATALRLGMEPHQFQVALSNDAQDLLTELRGLRAITHPSMGQLNVTSTIMKTYAHKCKSLKSYLMYRESTVRDSGS